LIEICKFLLADEDKVMDCFLLALSFLALLIIFLFVFVCGALVLVFDRFAVFCTSIFQVEANGQEYKSN